MPKFSEMAHPRSLDFRNQREVVILRDKGMSFPDIAGKEGNRLYVQFSRL